FFFFSSRRRHTRCYRDWSSDVCSSDLERRRRTLRAFHQLARANGLLHLLRLLAVPAAALELDRGIEPLACVLFHRVALGPAYRRSEERRVGKEWRSSG